MRVGVFRSIPWHTGGAYQYENALLEALAEVAARGAGDEFLCLTQTDGNLRGLADSGELRYRGVPVRVLEEQSGFQQAPLEAYLNQPPSVAAEYDLSRFYIDYGGARAFRRHGVDWIFQLQQSPVGFTAMLPFVMPIHDLQHLLQPEFPEVSAHGQTGLREFLYRNACRFATMVLVDSEQGKRDVLTCYGDLIGEDRIRILPYYPSTRQGEAPSAEKLAQVVARHKLPERFFFYPAQFWRHKNHILIIEALKRIEDATGERVSVVFCGTYVEQIRAICFKEMMDRAEALGVRDRVHYLGWVDDADIPALYQLSLGLVMPTFFGPTNIPVLEAWSYGRPVITSDLPGIREQTGGGGLLIDPRSPEQLADAMLLLWRDEARRDELAREGRRHLDAYDRDAFVETVAAIVAEVSARVREGRTPPYPAVPL